MTKFFPIGNSQRSKGELDMPSRTEASRIARKDVGWQEFTRIRKRSPLLTDNRWIATCGLAQEKFSLITPKTLIAYLAHSLRRFFKRVAVGYTICWCCHENKRHLKNNKNNRFLSFFVSFPLPRNPIGFFRLWNYNLGSSWLRFSDW